MKQLVLCISFFLTSGLFAQGDEANFEGDIFSLSLEELMNTRITTGTLSSVSRRNSPSAITSINREQIELSGARSLATLLEQYIPGLVLMTHSEGDKIGIRGLIAAENYKLLLLINGTNITNMVYEGAILELDLWEMGDIERVEVIRGPGSVTYGTGAIAGVINIITRTAADADSPLSVSISSVPDFQSEGISLSAAKKIEEWGVYFFSAYRETDGFDKPLYYAPESRESSDIRYVGRRTRDSNRAQPYLADSLGRAQIKTHLDISHGEDFRFWARYTQSGQTRNFNTLNTISDQQGNPLEEVLTRQVGLRGFALSAEYKHQLSDTLKLRSSLSYDNQEYIRYNLRNPQWSAEHHSNIRDYAFAQERITALVLADYQPNDNFLLTLGYEFSTINVQSPWGKSDDYLWVQEGADIISSVENSAYLSIPGLSRRPDPLSAIEVGSGIEFDTQSLLAEASYRLNENYQLQYSHRLDFPDSSGSMYSPRISLINELSERDSIRFSIQRSLRMVPLRAQYIFNAGGGSNSDMEYETLDSIEMAYTRVINSSAVISVNTYYNELDAVGFTGNDIQIIGDMNWLGAEFQADFSIGRTEISINHAYLELLDIKMNDALKDGSNRNNISFSDYDLITHDGDFPLMLQSYGDELNNWSNNSTRIMLVRRFLSNKFIARVNARINWDYGGSSDELGMYQAAYDSYDTTALTSDELGGFLQQKSQFERERDLLKAQDVYKKQLSVDATLTYRMSTNRGTQIDVTLFANNLFDDAVRYYVSTGSNKFYPERLKFMHEPRVFGLRATANF